MKKYQSLRVLYIVSVLLFAALNSAAQAQFSPDGVWDEIRDQELRAVQDAATAIEYWVKPDKFRAFDLNKDTLNQVLRNASLEGLDLPAESRPPVALIYLPTPDGEYMAFEFLEASVMAPELAAQFPEIKSYAGKSVDDSSITVRFDFTPAGFHAQVLAPGHHWYIDPHYKSNSDIYVSYYKADYLRSDKPARCMLDKGNDLSRWVAFPERSGDTLRAYRIAIATTGEYTQFHGGNLAQALAAINTTLNRVTGIYERELAIRLTLVANNTSIMFTNSATDPFNNNDAFALIDQSQTEIDNRIGSANYDIGHTFSTGAGGLAGLGVVCQMGSKASGVTGSSSPVGDAYDVDFVAHEIGHQFGGDHTFNGANGNCSGENRSAQNAYEPGSGSTIQAYAGICGVDNLQSNSDAVFHSESHAQMIGYVSTGSGSICGTTTVLNNTMPMVNAGANYTIPKNTPFALTGSGSDSDIGDTLTYMWEQRDLGPQATLTAADDGQIPLFRALTPNVSPTRYLPALVTLATNSMSNAEKLPQLARTMEWRLTVRDNNGGVDSDDISVTVNARAGPFQITSPNGRENLIGTANVTWSVANTHVAPVSAANVSIYLSTDGGQSFDMNNPLATNTPNDGSHTVALPNVTSNQARIMVKASNNIFFDISNQDFTVIPGSSLSVPNLLAPTGTTPDTTPTYQWTKIAGATQYQIHLRVGGAVAFNLWVTATEAGCSSISATQCEFTPSTVLDQGVPHRWWARAWSRSTGVGPWSSPQVFIVSDILSAPNLLAPTGTIADTTPTYQWSKVAGATQYQIHLRANSAIIFTLWVTASEAGCSSASATQCSFTSNTVLNQGISHRWWVRAWNRGVGVGPWSRFLSFIL